MNRGSRNRIASRLLCAAAVVLSVSALGAVAAPVASANGCRLFNTLCGEVYNSTGTTMSITTNLGAGSGYCDVWNWNGGRSPAWKHAHCSQQTMGNGDKGGAFSGVDVDAFTFARQGYYERFAGEGSYHWRIKGVWTKISDIQLAFCNWNGVIYCTVESQL